MDDEALLQAWTEGDQKAGETLFGRHFDALYRFFRTKAPYDYEDLIQTTMLECMRSREKIRSGTSFRPFLFGVARNCLLRLLRSRYRDRLDFDVDEVSCADLGMGPLERLALEQEQERLVEALRRIPLNLQILVELTYWEELSSREVGAVLDVPPSTIRHRLLRARKLLEKELHRTLDDGDVEQTMTGLETWAEEIRRMMGEPELDGDGGDGGDERRAHDA
ncbi:MAG: sigma-70 family RNA polymerase sigma factor [Myxococcales bacterium]|nr:sigma-70 family RNA polymerase sigma factor [Myxococcales bacterium]